jgi:pSer/pThr/pTyr-binding forkhead associated (FHA) protein
MGSELQLIFVEENRIRRVPVTSRRFNIGSSTENDLVIRASGLAPQHAVIEFFGDQISLTDCGSLAGTFINGNRVHREAVLNDRDLVAFGDQCEIEIQITDQETLQQTRPKQSNSRISERVALVQPADKASEPPLYKRTAVFLLIAAIVAIVAGGALYFGPFTRKSPPTRSEASAPETATVSRDPSSAPASNDSSERSTSDSLAVVNRLAVQVMRRISRDDRTYVFSDEVLKELSAQVDQYRSSPILARGLSDLDRDGRAFSIEVGREMQPSLVFYTALAETLGEQSGRTALAQSRGILGKLRELRVDFGTDDADSCLIVVAAYRTGSRSLLAGFGSPSVRKNPYTDRNVWYLHARGTINDDAYVFVLRFLAVGVIAEAPGRFGIDAPRLAF